MYAVEEELSQQLRPENAPPVMIPVMAVLLSFIVKDSKAPESVCRHCRRLKRCVLSADGESFTLLNCHNVQTGLDLRDQLVLRRAD